MRKVLLSHWFFILLLLGLSIFYVGGVVNIPFHPDESTYIFMSADFERIILNPRAMIWELGEPVPDVSRYRMIDAPLTRYWLGFGRTLASMAAPTVDWDWALSWEANHSSGALPDDRVLFVERLAIASLFPISLILLYLVGLKLGGRLLGIVAVLIFSFNPLIMLHTRRAMAEGVLVFGLLLSLYAFTKAEKRPLLAGLAVAVAFNAKHSAVVLLPIGLMAVSWQVNSSTRSISTLVWNISRYLAGFALLTALLNPFLWSNPISAAQEALKQRQELVARQQADIERFSPAQLLETPVERAAVVLTQLLIAPPIFSEVGNYRTHTLIAEEEYLSTPGNQVWRNSLSGGIILGLVLLGIFTAFHSSIFGNSTQRRILIIFLFSFLVMVAGIILMIPLPWQRYSVPLVPFISIIAGMGLVWGIKNSRSLFFHGSLYSRLTQILAQFAPDSWMS